LLFSRGAGDKLTNARGIGRKIVTLT